MILQEFVVLNNLWNDTARENSSDHEGIMPFKCELCAINSWRNQAIQMWYMWQKIHDWNHTWEKPYACNYSEQIPGETPPQRKSFGFWKFDFKSTNVFVVLHDLDFEMQKRIQTNHNDHKNNEKFVYLLEIKFWFSLWWTLILVNYLERVATY